MRNKIIFLTIVILLLFVTGYSGDFEKSRRLQQEIEFVSLPVGRAPTEIITSGSHAYVACFGDESVWIIHLPSQTITDVVPTGALPRALSKSPDGLHVFVSSYQSSITFPFPGNDCSSIVVNPQPGKLTMINTLSNCVEAVVSFPHVPPFVTLPSPDGNKLYTVTWDGTITVIDVNSASMDGSYYIDAPQAQQAVLSLDGRLLFISTEHISNELIVFDTLTHSLRSIPFDGTGCELTFGFPMVVDPSGLYLFTNAFYYQSGFATIVFSLSTETVVKQIPGNFGSLTFSHDGQKAYLLSQEYPFDEGVQFNLSTLEIENTLPTGGVSAVLTNDGSQLFLSRYGGPYLRRIEMGAEYTFNYEITVLNLEQNIAVENTISPEDIRCSYTREIAASGDGKHIIVSNSALNSVTITDYSRIKAPLNFSGVRQVNQSFLMTQYIDVLSWQENPSNQNIIKYRLYTVEEGVKQLLIELDAGIFQYLHRNVGKDDEYTYLIAAVDDQGEEGNPAYVIVR